MEFRLRQYQFDFYTSLKKAMHESGKAFCIAPTGYGKTAIIAKYLIDLKEENCLDNICVLAPTNLLCEQINEKLSMFKLPSSRQYNSALCVLTYHTFIKHLDKPFKLVIFDEAHKFKNSCNPYNTIKEWLQKFKPQVICFTATPGLEKNFSDIMKNLGITQAVVETKQVHSIDIRNQRISQSDSSKKDYLKLKKKYSHLLNVLGYTQISLPRLLNSHEYNIRILKKEKVQEYRYLLFFKQYYSYYLNYFQHYELSQQYSKKNKLFYKWAPQIPKKFNYLLDLCRQNLGQMIIYFENFSCALKFKDFLAKNGISDVCAIGGKTKMRKSERENVLNQLKTYRIIISTSVSEEGIDIGNVNLLLWHQPITNALRITQRLGRTGRSAPGEIVVLTYEDTFEIPAYDRAIKNYKQQQNFLNRL